MRVKKVHATITERADDWLRACAGEERAFNTATEALDDLKARAERAAEAGESSVMTIEWAPTTAVGRAIVRTLTGKAGA